MGTYLPTIKFKPRPNENVKELKERINEMIGSTIEENFKTVDSSFALENYNYVIAELGNEKLADLYRIMGPFDFGAYNPRDELGDQASPKDRDDKDGQSDGEESDSDKVFMQDFWDTRRSGARYRGELLGESKRPHGVGIKVFGKSSMYEGYFKDGACHGLGRGITSTGECYQGMFEEDEMTGQGMFYWPDGRIYEGEFYGGRKVGRGRIFWPNG